MEPSAALALTFTDVPVTQIELLGFLGRYTGLGSDAPTLLATTPYRKDLVPVVEYESAHIDEAVSELVVRSPHSCQSNPHTIEEVRRILRLHVGLPTEEHPRTTTAPRP